MTRPRPAECRPVVITQIVPPHDRRTGRRGLTWMPCGEGACGQDALWRRRL
jgi:hypothetical protein